MNRFAKRQLIGDDDPGVQAAALHPVKMQPDVISSVESEESSPTRRCEGQLCIVGQSPMLEFMAANNIKTAQAQCHGNSFVNVFIEIQTDKQGRFSAHAAAD